MQEIKIHKNQMKNIRLRRKGKWKNGGDLDEKRRREKK